MVRSVGEGCGGVGGGVTRVGMRRCEAGVCRFGVLAVDGKALKGDGVEEGAAGVARVAGWPEDAAPGPRHLPAAPKPAAPSACSADAMKTRLILPRVRFV